MLEIGLLKDPSNRPLTTGADIVTGTAGDDTFNAVDVLIGTQSSTTDGVTTTTNVFGTSLGSADNISGGDGQDTLNVVGSAAITVAGSTVVAGVEAANFTTLAGLTANVSSWTGLTSANVLKSVAATVTAAATTDVSVTGATGAIIVDGGKAVTVSAATSNQAVTIGDTTVNAGAVSVTHSKQGSGGITIDGGTNVSVTTSAVSSGTLSVGNGAAATDRPTGSVNVTSTGTAYSDSADAYSLGAITVKGGTSVSVAQSATSSTAKAAADTTAVAVTQSAVTVTAVGTTSAVTVTQDATVTAVNAVVAVAAVNEVSTVTFGALVTGESVTIGGLTYTANVNNTAAQVSAAFANLATGATVGANAAARGDYSGSFTAEHSSGAAVNTGTTADPVWKVVFTGSGAADNLTALTSNGLAGLAAGPAADNATFVAALTQDGNNATAAKTGVMGVVGGAVGISDIGTTDAVAAVTLSGFGVATVVSDALSTLGLSNSVGPVTVTNAVTKALALNVSGYGSSTTAAALDVGSTYTSLTVDTGAVAGSDVTLSGAGLTSLTVSGSKALDLNGTALAALETVKVSGAGGLKATGLTAATTTSFDMSASSGANTVTVNATVATYAGGTGVDSVTLSAAAPTKSVNLGDGNDTLTLAAGTTSSTAALAGGDGTDTLVIAAANAATASADASFEAKISGFERLSFGGVAATAVIDLANLDEISNVTVGAVSALLSIDNMAIGGTVVLTGENSFDGTDIDVDFVDATGLADNLNVTVQVSTANLGFGTVDISGIESLALTATDTATTAADDVINTATIAIADTALKSVTISGNANVVLSVGAAVTTIDGSAMTGKLTATSNTVATAITGGSGADTLTASVTGSTIVGGAGSDTLIGSANLVTLTGGAGSDTFDISTVRSNANSYATITDFSAGDKLKVGGTGATVDFISAKVTLAATASFADYANAAAVAAGADDVAWFQFGGDTYLVQDLGDDSLAANGFINGQDNIVRLAGTIDLSLLAFNSTALTFA